MKTTLTRSSDFDANRADDVVIDCRSEEGITIGLIDAIISVSRVLARRSFESPSVAEALKDLNSDEDLRLILDRASNAFHSSG